MQHDFYPWHLTLMLVYTPHNIKGSKNIHVQIKVQLKLRTEHAYLTYIQASRISSKVKKHMLFSQWYPLSFDILAQYGYIYYQAQLDHQPLKVLLYCAVSYWIWLILSWRVWYYMNWHSNYYNCNTNKNWIKKRREMMMTAMNLP